MEYSVFNYCLIFLIFIFVPDLAQANCEESYIAIFENPEIRTNRDRINAWSDLRDECGGTGTYEVRLAALYYDGGENEKALTVIEKAISAGLPNKGELLFAKSQYNYSLGNLDIARTTAQELLSINAKPGEAHFVLGLVALENQKFNHAIERFIKVNEFTESANAYSMLAICYYNIRNFHASIESMRTAIAMDNNEIANTNPIVAATYSLIHLGYLDRAAKLLNVHQDYKPESEFDPEFARVVGILEEAIESINE